MKQRAYDEDASLFEELSSELQTQIHVEMLNLGRIQPLIIVWGLALEQANAFGICETEDLIKLNVEDIWGEGSTVTFNREKRAVFCRHPEGLEKLFYADQIDFEKLMEDMSQ